VGGGLKGAGGVFERGVGNFRETVVSIHYKEIEYKVEMLKYKKVVDHEAGDHNEIQAYSW